MIAAKHPFMTTNNNQSVIKDAARNHWIYKMPTSWQPFLQLSRLDRPIGYWLLALPGWIGLAFASLSHGIEASDLKWAVLILIGAIAMRGAGCTYNDIVDQDLDKQVERTALRPLPAGTITSKQAWIWLMAQCMVGFIVLLCLPRLAQIISLCSLPLVAAYPFMKRITWWPQVWLGMTFNWAVLVAHAAKTETITIPLLILYAGLIFWTIGYDTIYACQDIEDDAMAGIKSTARRFGSRVKLGVGVCYSLAILLTLKAFANTQYLWQLGEPFCPKNGPAALSPCYHPVHKDVSITMAIYVIVPMTLHFVWQILSLKPNDDISALKRFKSNAIAAILLIISIIGLIYAIPYIPIDNTSDDEILTITNIPR